MFYGSSLRNLAVHNHQLQYTLTTQQQLESSTIQSNDKDHEQWRWDTFWLLNGKMQRYFKFYYQPGLKNLGNYWSKHHTANIYQHIRPYYVHMNNSPTLLPRAMKPRTCQGCAEILGDPYSKKSTLSSISNFPHLANSPKLSSNQVLGQSRIQQRHTTRYNHQRLGAK